MLQPAPEGTGCIFEVSSKSLLLLLRRLLRSFLLSACFLLCGHPGLTSFLVRFSRSAACTPPPNARERHGCRGRAGADEAGYRKQRGKRKTRGPTAGRDRPSESAIPRDGHHRHGPRRFVSVALLQLLALITSTMIRARLSAH